MRPPRVLTRSFPLMTVPSTAGAPCSYWTLTCLAVSSALRSLMSFLFVSPVVCSRLPSDSTSRWTPLPFSYPFPTAGQGRDFHPIERAPAGRTKIKSTRISRADSYLKPVLVQVANALIKSKKHPETTERYRRIKSHRGHKKATIAIFRMLLTAIWHILTDLKLYTAKGYLIPHPVKNDKILTTSQALNLLKLRGYVIKKDDPPVAAF